MMMLKRVKNINLMQRAALFTVVLLFMLMGFLFWESVSVRADEAQTISTYEELEAIRSNPSGSYVLANDIDLAGKDWTPLDFSGTFDGAGHAILNVSVSKAGTTIRTTYDGNMKTYDTVFAGFFGTLENASVKDLKLVNIRADITENKPCFVGGIAGFMEQSAIDGCTVTGRLDLTIDAKMFGVGGIVGFGNGSVDNTVADMTLVSIDTNVKERDEQFMGGGYAAGYISLGDCRVTVRGFDSDHGYVHNGGLVGMFGMYPAGTAADTYITNNHVEGKITFFEDNTDRRAYCAPYCGEVLNWTYKWGGCTSDFESDERKEYNVNLLPDMCENPSYSKTVTESTDADYGYTTYQCGTCGYTYTDHYTLKMPDLLRLEESAKKEEASREEASRFAEQSLQDGTKSDVPGSDTDMAERHSILQSTWLKAVLVAVLAVACFIWMRQRHKRKHSSRASRNRKMKGKQR